MASFLDLLPQFLPTGQPSVLPAFLPTDQPDAGLTSADVFSQLMGSAPAYGQYPGFVPQGTGPQTAQFPGFLPQSTAPFSSTPTSYGQSVVLPPSYGQQAASAGGSTATGSAQLAAPLGPGGIYGQQKWSGGNGIDLFTRRGSPIYAMFDGTVSPHAMPGGGMGSVPALVLSGSGGLSAQYTHVQGSVTGPVKQGQLIGYVNDPSLDMLGAYPGMPDNFQHLDLTIGHSGASGYPVTGGDLNAAQVLQSIGYQGQQIGGTTRGPNGSGGMGMGMGLPSPYGGQQSYGQPGASAGFPFGGQQSYGQQSYGGGFNPTSLLGGGGGQQGGGANLMAMLQQRGGGQPSYGGYGGGQASYGGYGTNASPNPFMMPASPYTSMPQVVANPAAAMGAALSLPSFQGFGGAPSPMGMGLGGPFNFGAMNSPMAAPEMQLPGFEGFGAGPSPMAEGLGFPFGW